ncbi:MAG: TIGR00730 family Rossman fold protein [Myxococcales bacterium]|nr:TIGR00730 family Rossman fold protein [Myxococcales bacterium]|tara:strand:+ start:928 stop:1479 length:552 start_codon:yes stop_codon:yes gene_type:complete
MAAIRRIAVYCGASNTVPAAYLQAASEVGRTLAEHTIGVVFGGGHVGLMGRLADGALEAGGEVIGVIPERLKDRELAHPGCTEMIVVETMRQRKEQMEQRADAFVALPGGLGTLDEIFEVATLQQLDYHSKPLGFLNLNGYYDHLESFFDRAVADRFLSPTQRAAFSFRDNFPSLLEELRAHE